MFWSGRFVCPRDYMQSNERICINVYYIDVSLAKEQAIKFLGGFGSRNWMTIRIDLDLGTLLRSVSRFFVIDYMCLGSMNNP